MLSRNDDELIYPFHVQLVNTLLKKYVNLYWSIIDVCSNHFEVLSHVFYGKKIREEYDREHALLNLHSSDVILHIGCGVYPYSALVLSEKNNKKIVTIDKNQKVIKYARQIIQDNHLDQKITAETGEASSVDLNPFSVIISSSCVHSSAGVTRNILKHAHPGTRIIIRELRPMSKYVKNFIENQDNLELLRQFSTISFPFYHLLAWDSFILRKK
jgi:2-polyprenyl-3-methyl-5-hydroxy-6-metoxy-1,4-benzoquinol methylase